MKLRTSFFNLQILRKNMTRFAPVWVLYSVAEVLGLMSIKLNHADSIANELVSLMGPLCVAHGIYGLIVAVCLFGDLFDSRMCNGLHALPMRRDGWLITNLLSGLLFALIPAVVGGTVAAVALGSYYWVALIWQATGLLQFVFFFGIAVFSAMCAGKRLSMIAIYGFLNFLSMLIYWLATSIYEPLLPGVVLSDDWFRAFCPIVFLVSDTYVDFYYDKILGGFFNGYIAESWCYLYICAAVGVVFTGLGWILYRKRHLERAGDFISFRPMGVFFLLAYTFALGALLYSMGELFGTYRYYSFLAVGLIIGWFTGWMLLERTVRIFGRKTFGWFAVFALLFAGSIGLTVMDPMGIVTYVPQMETVEYACLYPLSERYYYYAKEGFEGRRITDSADLETVLQLHQQMIVTPEDPDTETINMEMQYRLKNGRVIYRAYDVPAASPVTEDLAGFLSDMRSVFLTEDVAYVWENVNYAHFYLLDDNKGQKDLEIRNPERLRALLSAIEADCLEGNFAQHDYFHDDHTYVAGLDITWKAGDTEESPEIRSKHIIIYDDCSHALAFLESLTQ